MLSDENKLRIFTGNANPDLAREIAAYLGTTVGDSVVNRFNNGEVQVMINESVRGKDIFIVQPTCGPIVNDNVMELLIMADAFKRASANHITAVIPYYGYARQDRKARGREPITAKLMADLLETAGITRVVTIDLHAAQIQGFFNIPFDHMPGGPLANLQALPMMWLVNIPRNFIMALPWNLLVAGPIARFVFRRAFPMGTVLEEPIELADLGAIGGENEVDDFAVEAV